MNKSEQRMNVGGAFIILILIVMTMSVFAVLSIRSSSSEYRLAKKSAESIKKACDVDSAATEKLAKIDRIVMESGNKGLTEDSFSEINPTSITVTDGALTTIEYSVADDKKSIEVRLSYSGTKCAIEKWKSVTDTSDTQYEIEIPD